MFLCHGVQRGLHGLRDGNLVDIPRELGVFDPGSPARFIRAFGRGVGLDFEAFFGAGSEFFSYAFILLDKVPVGYDGI